MNSFQLYLFESSASILLLGLVYKWLLSRQTHFVWMRAFLLVSVITSLILPFFPAPVTWLSRLITPDISVPSFSNSIFTVNWLGSPSTLSGQITVSETESIISLPFLLLLAYLSGIAYRLVIFGTNLQRVCLLIWRSTKRREGNYWLIHSSHQPITFSFLNYVFIRRQPALTSEETEQVLKHELAHVRQRHTLDLLLFELTHILLWFHPIVTYFKQQLREVHEYLADQAVVRKPEEQKGYAQLLLKLASKGRALSLTTRFSGKQVGRRIAMLSKPRSHSKHRWLFASIIPLCTSIFFLSACLEEPTTNHNSTLLSSDQSNNESDRSKIIGEIQWEGNSIYNAESLTEALGMQPGDLYDSVTLNQQLSYNPEGGDLSSLYMDKGYLFFSVNVQKTEPTEGIVNLKMSIYEGDLIKVSEIRILGNQDIPREDILKEVPIEPGELFSRSKLIASQRAIADMGYFDVEQVNIHPIPDIENKEVAIKFTLKRNATQQNT